MRTIVIALMLAVASAAAEAQTTKGARQPTYDRGVFERTARFHNWAPVGEVREREAALEQATTALADRRVAIEEDERTVGRRETAVSQRERDVLTADAAVSQREEDVLTAEAAVSQREEKAARIENESIGIAWAAVILGAAVAAWSLWRLQPSTVSRLNQRRRAAEQNLASMQGERDEAQGQLRKRANALMAATRKNTLLRKARDEAEARCRDGESANAQLGSDLEDERRIKALIGEARDRAEGRRREAEATITRLKATVSRVEVELEDAKQRTAQLRKARDEAEGKRQVAQGAITRLNATISRLRVELEDAKRNADGRNMQGTARHILGVPAGASRNDVRAAWKRVARTVHPDHCAGPEAKRLMQLANDALSWLKA